MKALITVIIPAYRVEKYIDKCLKSVNEQTYKNLEILVIDDGSDDNLSCACDVWALYDGRIKVVHKHNGGLSDARNAGLDIAAGDYIGFVDSDDYIEPDMFELLVKNMENEQADISCCRYAKVYEDGAREPVGDDHSIHVYDGLAGLKEFLYGKVVDPFVSNKLYQAHSICNSPDRPYSIRFIKGTVGEDVPFNSEILKHTNRIVVAGEAKYNYLQQRAGAITNSDVSQKKIDSVFWWDKIRNECHKSYPELEEYALRRQVLFYVGLYNDIYNNHIYQKDKEKIVNFLKEQRKKILSSAVCEKIIKISVALLTTLPWLYICIMKLYKKMVGSAERINE